MAARTLCLRFIIRRWSGSRCKWQLCILSAGFVGPAPTVYYLRDSWFYIKIFSVPVSTRSNSPWLYDVYTRRYYRPLSRFTRYYGKRRMIKSTAIIIDGDVILFSTNIFFFFNLNNGPFSRWRKMCRRITAILWLRASAFLKGEYFFNKMFYS